MYFDFNEINILGQNLNEPNLPGFIEQLAELEDNTKEEVLISSIRSLREKLLALSMNDFHLLYEELKGGKVVATEGYYLELF